MMSIPHWVVRSVFVASVWLMAGSGASAAYPDRLVRIVVPYPAGGGVDVIARGLANQLAQRWGQPVIVENRAGPMTTIGANVVSKAPPDGYTLLLTTDATITTNPHLLRKMPFDPMKDLVPLVHVVNLSFIVIVNPNVPATSMSGLVAMAKSDKPPPLFFSSSGNGSQAHLMFEALNHVAGTTLTHVPYAGIAPAIQAVVSGDVQMTLAGGTSEPLIESGLVRPLAISAEKRDFEA